MSKTLQVYFDINRTRTCTQCKTFCRKEQKCTLLCGLCFDTWKIELNENIFKNEIDQETKMKNKDKKNAIQSNTLTQMVKKRNPIQYINTNGTKIKIKKQTKNGTKIKKQTKNGTKIKIKKQTKNGTKIKKSIANSCHKITSFYQFTK